MPQESCIKWLLTDQRKACGRTPSRLELLSVIVRSTKQVSTYLGRRESCWEIPCSCFIHTDTAPGCTNACILPIQSCANFAFAKSIATRHLQAQSFLSCTATWESFAKIHPLGLTVRLSAKSLPRILVDSHMQYLRSQILLFASKICSIGSLSDKFSTDSRSYVALSQEYFLQRGLACFRSWFL